MRDVRRGFTLTEMMIVVAILGGLALFSLPRFGGLSERSRVSSARQELEAAIATARAAAIQKGRESQFVLQNHAMMVWVQISETGVRDTIIPAKSLDSLYRVRVTPNMNVTFNSRGFITSPTSGLKYVLVGGSRKDSVCFKRTGQLMPRGCAL